MNTLKEIVEKFQEKEVKPYVQLDDKICWLISLSVVTALGTTRHMDEIVEQAAISGLSSEAMAEAIIHCTPYAGYPKAQEGLDALYETLEAKGMALPSGDQSTVTEATRMKKGLEAQYFICGQELIDANRQNAPEELKHIQDYLSDYCFGDFYTRGAIDIHTRELLTFVILAALGCVEPQLKAHIAGNLNVGNDRSVLLSAITWCVPYIGFPKTLNAINAINTMTKE